MEGAARRAFAASAEDSVASAVARKKSRRVRDGQDRMEPRSYQAIVAANLSEKPRRRSNHDRVLPAQIAAGVAVMFRPDSVQARGKAFGFRAISGPIARCGGAGVDFRPAAQTQNMRLRG